MKNKKEMILERACRLFMERGYSDVTMDDVARMCGVGKATLYQYFDSKEKLLYECVDSVAERIQTEISVVLNDSSIPAGLQLKIFFKTVLRLIAGINKESLADMQRHVPHIYEHIEERRRQIIFKNLTRVIDVGKEQDVFEQDLDVKLVVCMITGTVSCILDNGIDTDLPYTLDGLMNRIISLILRGCLTETGRQVFQERM